MFSFLSCHSLYWCSGPNVAPFILFSFWPTTPSFSLGTESTPSVQRSMCLLLSPFMLTSSRFSCWSCNSLELPDDEGCSLSPTIQRIDYHLNICVLCTFSSFRHHVFINDMNYIWAIGHHAKGFLDFIFIDKWSLFCFVFLHLAYIYYQRMYKLRTAYEKCSIHTIYDACFDISWNCIFIIDSGAYLYT